MSRHLEQTGPIVTAGSRSGFHQAEEEADVPASSAFIGASRSAPSLSLTRVRRVCGSGVTRPNPAQS